MSYDAGWYELVEAEHEFQNPVSRESIHWLGEQLRAGEVTLGWSRHLLDVACGTCGPAIVLAEDYGCRVTCVDSSAPFLEIAEKRIAEARVRARIDLVEMDGQAFLERSVAHFDGAICLGASFVLGGLVPALEQLFDRAPVVAIGEPYVSLKHTLAQIRSVADELDVDVRTSSEDEWGEYEARRSLALRCWLMDHPEKGTEYREREREAQQRRRQEGRGWAIFVVRRSGAAR